MSFGSRLKFNRKLICQILETEIKALNNLLEDSNLNLANEMEVFIKQVNKLFSNPRHIAFQATPYTYMDKSDSSQIKKNRLRS